MNEQFLINSLTIAAVFITVEMALYFIRERKTSRAQQFLRRAKEEIEEVSQLPLNTPYPMMKISSNLAVLYANPAALKNFPNLKSTQSAHDILRGLENTMKDAHNATREIEYDGRIFHQTITTTQISKDRSYLVYCYDITKRKEHERDLQIAYKQTQLARIDAEHANQARGDFLANMSHELRTPMNGIIGLSNILTESNLTAEHHELAEAISNSSTNLLSLLNDILDFSKIEAGELTIETISMDLRQLAAHILKLHNPVASSKNLTLRLEIDEDVPQNLIGDPSRLQQILNNLIGNALKFTTHGAVTLLINGTTDHQSGMFNASIAVRDTGIGIPKDKQVQIFKKFQQADTSTARKFGGTGLGLAITKELTKIMNGKISIESVEGKGSTFTITLPLTITDQMPKTKDSMSATIVENRLKTLNTTSRILVVDDHPINLLYLTTALKKFGFKDYQEASSGVQAFKLCQKQPYDMIFMDCQMPDMDGFETTARIRTLSSAEHTTIIAVTADAIQGAKDKCLKSGMDDYISKPVHKADLLAALEKHLPHKSNVTPIKTIDTIDKAEVNTDVLDRSVLYDFTEGDKEMEARVLDIFISNLKVDISALHKSYLTKNFVEWDSWVHKLYGACAHMGANAMADICDQAQFIKPNQPEQIKELHHDILEEYKRLHNTLTSESNKTSAHS